MGSPPTPSVAGEGDGGVAHAVVVGFQSLEGYVLVGIK